MKAADLLEEMHQTAPTLIDRYPEILRAMGDGRLKFTFNHVFISGKRLSPDDYVVLSETGELIHVTNKYFHKNFVAI